MTERMLAGQIDALLPQTQCAKCGYSACMPYAEAIAAGEADINQCPPGGEAGIGKLARLLQQSAKPLNPANGAARPRTLAFIDEARCIGCTLCIRPVGRCHRRRGQVHAHRDRRTVHGLRSVPPPCPVDCIAMLPLPEAQAPWTQAMADAPRTLRFRNVRLAREQAERANALTQSPGKTDATHAG